MTNTKSAHITPIGGNVFADLGFDPKEATALKSESQRIVSEKLAVKESVIKELAGRLTREACKVGLALSPEDSGRRSLPKEQQEKIQDCCSPRIRRAMFWLYV